MCDNKLKQGGEIDSGIYLVDQYAPNIRGYFASATKSTSGEVVEMTHCWTGRMKWSDAVGEDGRPQRYRHAYQS